MTDDAKLIQLVGRMMPILDERQRRIFLGSLSDFLGRGSVTKLQTITKVSRSTIALGKEECWQIKEDPAACPRASVTAQTSSQGAGRKSMAKRSPGLTEALLSLLEGCSADLPLCWTLKSLRELEGELKEQGFDVSLSSVQDLLHEQGFALQHNQRRRSESACSKMKRQFDLINSTCQRYIAQGQPVISLRSGKKILAPRAKLTAMKTDSAQRLSP